MKLELQVCSLEKAKRLKELGVKQESYFCYFNNPDIDGFVQQESWNLKHIQIMPLSSARLKSADNRQAYISAFTVAELGHILPYVLNTLISSSHPKQPHFEMLKNSDEWLAVYAINENQPPIVTIIENTEADCRAAMLIYLIENKLINLQFSLHDNSDTNIPESKL